MAIHPIDYRYSYPKMRAIFEEENILAKKLLVEAALAQAHAQVGNIPVEDADEIARHANTKEVTLARVSQIEMDTQHDLMAIVRALAERCGESGKHVHLGATSYDIVDTSWALLFKEALKIILHDLMDLKDVLLVKARVYRDLVVVGRTHGQHAVPTTLGLKFAVWASEIYRQVHRILEAEQEISVGKLTGAVGTGASLGEKAVVLQKNMMDLLGLECPLATTQIVQRDRHAQVIFALGNVGQTLEKIAKEIRNLQRTEINELYESFGEKQVGSSTMPQKRNPWKSERICGLARVLRSNVLPALENVPLEHERDLTNSSCERVIFPESFILCDFMLKQLTEIVKNLQVNEEGIKNNLKLTKGRIMAEAVMVKLAGKGLGRQGAHELVRKCSMESFEQDRGFGEVLALDPDVKRYLSREEIKNALVPENYIGSAQEQVDNVIKEIS